MSLLVTRTWYTMGWFCDGLNLGAIDSKFFVFLNWWVSVLVIGIYKGLVFQIYDKRLPYVVDCTECTAQKDGHSNHKEPCSSRG